MVFRRMLGWDWNFVCTTFTMAWDTNWNGMAVVYARFLRLLKSFLSLSLCA